MYKDLDKQNGSRFIKDKAALDQAIKNILLTKKGTVPGKPEFGSGIYYFLFENLDHITIAAMKREIERNLRQYESRIEVQAVNVSEQPEFNRVIISVDYNLTGIKTDSFETVSLILNI